MTRALDKAPAVAPRGGSGDLPSVAIIGAGLSAIATAVYLKKAGIPFTIYEKNDEVGGTWYDNHYPGCGVDITSHSRSGVHWPGRPPPQGEPLST